MPLKSIIRQDSPKIWMSRKDHAEHIKHLPLWPDRRGEERGDGGYGGHFVSVGAEEETGVVVEGEKSVDKFETMEAGGIVDGCELHALREACIVMVPEEGEDGVKGGGGNVERKLILIN